MPKRRTPFGSSANCHVTGVVSSPLSIAMKRFLLVRIDSHVRSNLFHDRLRSPAALAPQPLTRDLDGTDHLVECDRTTTLR